MIGNAEEVLHKYYGYETFKRHQKEVIESILSGRDTLAVMPTGGGKSICYQIPALLFNGVTIVISPLISLMKDQVDNISELGIKASYINSSISQQEILSIFSDLMNGKVKILYVAPERLDSPEFYQLMKTVEVSQVAVDEAHCVSQWGHDFRISYTRISKFIESFSKRPVVTAFTATATEKVREDIVNQIKLKKAAIFISGFDRENLKISCLKTGNKFQYLLNYVKTNETQSGIIYASTRKEVDNVYEKLKSNDLSVTRYHAGLPDRDRKINQEDFVYDKVNIIVATNAFGMGIDKSNVRYVIHYNMPQNIESYYQEIGRAGRDGESSECILMFSPQDVITQKYLIETSIQSPERRINEYKKLQHMIDFVHYNGCLRKFILNYFGEEVNYNQCDNCGNCINSGEYVDKTVDAQKVISCVYRMKREFGVNMIVDVLRGSSQKKVLQYRFDKLSTYGIMRDYSKEELSNFINTIIAHKYITLKEGEYPTVVLNAESIKVLKGEKKVVLKESVKVNKISVNNDLFEILRSLRREIASEESIPPYMVFSDATLKELSIRYPIDENQMLDISGVGDLKLKKYGEKFLNIIKKYVEENKIQPDWWFKIGTASKIERKSDKPKTHYITISMLKENVGIREIAKKRQLTLSTILTHITKYFEEENVMDINIKFEELFSCLEEKEVLKAIDKVGMSKLRPIKELVPDNIDYDKIRAIIIKNYILKEVAK